MRAVVIFALCAAGQVVPDSASAQRLDDARVAARYASADAIDTTVPQQNPASRTRVFWVRALTATVGSGVGAYAGFAMGHVFTGRRVDDWGIITGQELAGMAIGFLTGAALGAAMHSYDSKCAAATRFLKGLGGAALGFLPGALIGPFGPGLGAAALQGRC